MNVAILGSGGREHAICQKISESKKIKKIFCIPGNAGTGELAQNINIELSNFKMLLKKTGWNVVAEEKFTNPVLKIGFRPILRMFTPRYLLIYAEKKSFK